LPLDLVGKLTGRSVSPAPSFWHEQTKSTSSNPWSKREPGGKRNLRNPETATRSLLVELTEHQWRRHDRTIAPNYARLMKVSDDA
jgi:hypothetical protein